MTGIIDKLTKYVSNYLSTRLVFASDVFLSTLSSLCVILISNEVLAVENYMGVFVIYWTVLSFVSSVIMFLITRCDRIIIRHMSLRDVSIFFAALLGKTAVMAVVLAFKPGIGTILSIALAIDFVLGIFLIIGIRVFLIVAYNLYISRLRERQTRKRILIYGTSEKAVSVVTRLKNSTHYDVIGFATSERSKQTMTIDNLHVYSFTDIDTLRDFVYNTSLYGVIFATDGDLRNEKKGLVELCNKSGVRLLVAPSIEKVGESKSFKQMRNVNIEDLLGRAEINISLEEIRKNLHGKVVMVTGAAGSIGSELVRQIATFDVKKVVLFDNAETPMHNLRLELEEHYPNLDFVPVIGDVRLENRLEYAFRRWQPTVVFHAAAYKHVPLMEENPCEAVLVNVVGSRNVADKCVEHGAEMMVMISTDKAVNPTNIMGCTKRLAEIYVQSLGLELAQKGEITLRDGKTYKGNTKFVTTRFGNVLGSNGSVIPRFREQIASGGPVTVTHPEITRFFMTIPEACRLVMEASTISSGNQICVFDMGESVKIDSLARNMIELAGLVPGKDIEIEYTGLRPGEKLYEEVLSTVENTLPTSHDRIRIATVRQYGYSDAVNVVKDLEKYSRMVDIPEMVKYMKRIVPEFKSNNSPYEIYDTIPNENLKEE